MKKYFISIASVLLVLGALFSIPHVRAGVSALSIFSTNTQNPANANSTTTVQYLTAGSASTTLAFNTTTSNQEQMFVMFTASTSNSTLRWQYEFSNDNVNWFEEDIPAQFALGVGIVEEAHASTTIIHSWKPGSITASTTYKAVLMPNIASKFTRVQFSIPPGSTNGAVWAQAVAQSINPN